MFDEVEKVAILTGPNSGFSYPAQMNYDVANMMASLGSFGAHMTKRFDSVITILYRLSI